MQRPGRGLQPAQKASRLAFPLDFIPLEREKSCLSDERNHHQGSSHGPTSVQFLTFLLSGTQGLPKDNPPRTQVCDRGTLPSGYSPS